MALTVLVLLAVVAASEANHGGDWNRPWTGNCTWSWYGDNKFDWYSHDYPDPYPADCECTIDGGNFTAGYPTTLIELQEYQLGKGDKVVFHTPYRKPVVLKHGKKSGQQRQLKGSSYFASFSANPKWSRPGTKFFIKMVPQSGSCSYDLVANTTTQIASSPNFPSKVGQTLCEWRIKAQDGGQVFVEIKKYFWNKRKTKTNELIVNIKPPVYDPDYVTLVKPWSNKFFSADDDEIRILYHAKKRSHLSFEYYEF